MSRTEDNVFNLPLEKPAFEQLLDAFAKALPAGLPPCCLPDTGMLCEWSAAGGEHEDQPHYDLALRQYAMRVAFHHFAARMREIQRMQSK